MIDCHSFPSRPLPYELNQAPERPQICIGTDVFHTPSWLSDAACQLFEQRGFDVALDHPFAGALVPNSVYRTNSAVYALMIELNRSLYMCERTGVRGAGFIETRATVRAVLTELLPIATHRHRER